MGPVQLLTVRFHSPEMRGRIAIALGELSQQGVIRVLDALAVRKDAAGAVTTTQFSNLSPAEAEEVGGPIRRLLGFAPGEPEGHVLSLQELVDAVAEMPPDTAVGVALLEHVWAIPLQEAIGKSGGESMDVRWLRPPDLEAAGLA